MKYDKLKSVKNFKDSECIKEKIYIGYVHVSSTDQNETRQLKALEKFGKSMRRIFIDRFTGKSADMLRLVNKLQENGMEIISL